MFIKCEFTRAALIKVCRWPRTHDCWAAAQAAMCNETPWWASIGSLKDTATESRRNNDAWGVRFALVKGGRGRDHVVTCVPTEVILANPGIDLLSIGRMYWDNWDNTLLGSISAVIDMLGRGGNPAYKKHHAKILTLIELARDMQQKVIAEDKKLKA